MMATTQSFTSWGRVLRTDQQVLGMPSRHASLPLPADAATTVLPYG
ncbi:MAG: hypothetical protein H7225_16550, partial [Massilia sp.]|nr:hypothetical protein [Aquabacterium sp.]